MEAVLAFLRAAMPWISMGLLVVFLCARPALRKSKVNDENAVLGMCIGMSFGVAAGSAIDAANAGLGASLGMLAGLVIGLCLPGKDEGKKEK